MTSPPTTREIDELPRLSGLFTWIGVVLVVLAVVFLGATAYQRGWFGVEAALVAAIGASSALVCGAFTAERHGIGPWRHVLASGGIVGFTVTFASSLLVTFVGESWGLALIALTIVGGLVLAIVLSSSWTAATAMACGVIGPNFLHLLDRGVTDWLVWMTLVVTATGLVAHDRGWTDLRTLAVALQLCTTLSAAIFGEVWPALSTVESAAVVLGLGFGTLILLTVPSIPTNGADRRGTLSNTDARLSTVVGPWLLLGLLLVLGLKRTEAGALALGIGCLLGAYAVAGATVRSSVRLQRNHALALALSACITVSAGLFMVIRGPWALTALAVQGAALAWLWSPNHTTAELPGRRIRYYGVGLCFVTLLPVTDRLEDSWAEWMGTSSFLAMTLAAAVGGATVALCSPSRLRPWGILTSLAVGLMWVGAPLAHLDQGQALVSLAWATVGSTILIHGFRSNQPPFAWTGLAVLGLTVLKLLTIDLAEVDPVWRACLFAGIGLGFLRLAWYLPRLESAGESGHPLPEPVAGETTDQWGEKTR